MSSFKPRPRGKYEEGAMFNVLNVTVTQIAAHVPKPDNNLFLQTNDIVVSFPFHSCV